MNGNLGWGFQGLFHIQRTRLHPNKVYIYSV